MWPVASPDPVREAVQRRFLVVVVLLVSVLFLWMIRQFLTALLMAAIFTGLTTPAYRWVLQRVGQREYVASGTVVLGLLLGVVGPLMTFLALVAAQALDLSEVIRQFVAEHAEQPGGLQEVLRTWLQSLPFGDRLAQVEAFLPERDQLAQQLGEAMSSFGSLVVSGVAAATRNTATLFLDLFVFLYAMFFFLVRGDAILERILYYAPLEPDDEHAVVDRFLSVTRATIKGSLVIGALQGLLAAVGFWAAGIPGVLLWGTIMAILSVIPGVGAALVWVPAVLWLAFSGAIAAAIGLGAWCGLVVGTVDNVLRPRLVGADTKMSDLMILLGTLGGISLFGVVGVLIGPIVAAVFVTVWELYGTAFRDLLPATRSGEGDA